MVDSLKAFCATWSDNPDSWQVLSQYRQELVKFMSRHLRVAIQLDILRSEPSSLTPEYREFFTTHLWQNNLFHGNLISLIPFPLNENAFVFCNNETIICPGYSLICIQHVLEVLMPTERYRVSIHHKDCFTLEVRQLLWTFIGDCLDHVPSEFYNLPTIDPNTDYSKGAYYCSYIKKNK